MSMTGTLGWAVLDSATSRGEGQFNEDLGGSTHLRAWVLDGATDVPATARPDPAKTGARWIVEQVDGRLRKLRTDLPLRETFGSLATAVRTELGVAGVREGEIAPACSAGIISVGATLQAGIVGDIYIYNVSQRELLSTDTFDRNEKSAASRAGLPQAGGTLTGDGITSRRRDYLSGRRGAWILGDNPLASEGVILREWPACEGQVILMCTDGFARALTSYGLFENWEELSNAVLEMGIANVVALIRDHEAKDGSVQEHFKASDDIFAMIIKCTTAEVE